MDLKVEVGGRFNGCDCVARLKAFFSTALDLKGVIAIGDPAPLVAFLIRVDHVVALKLAVAH
jgi:hypothetical protein